MLYPKILLSLIEQLRKLPGVGRKSAERFAFKILDWSPREITLFANTLSQIPLGIEKCASCGCFKEGETCAFCKQAHGSSQLCIVATAKDAYAIAHTKAYRGYYHALGCLISPLEGKTPEHLCVPKIKNRIESLSIKEVVLALDPTLEGDATSLYLYEQLQKDGVKVTRLALGLPLGSSLDFIDEGTLSQALNGRQIF